MSALLEDLFAGGRILDIVLVVMIIEAVLVAGFAFKRSWRRKAVPVFWGVLPGIFLVLGARALLNQAPWGWAGLWLTLALVAHGIDLVARLRPTKK
jgi:hypothetical protein